MNLLDFSPEVFQQIIHELILDVGVAKAWKKYSLVCRTFAFEVRTDILTKQDFNVFREGDFENIVESSEEYQAPWMSPEFSQQDYEDGDRTGGKSGEDTSARRQEFTERLCSTPWEAATWGDCPWWRFPWRLCGLFEMVEHGCDWTEDFSAASILSAAAVVECPEAWKRLLPEYASKNDGDSSPLPLGVASSLGRVDRINEVFQYFRTLPARTRKACFMLSSSELKDVMATAIYYRHYGSMDRIFKLCGLRPRFPTVSIYNEWLEIAGEKRDTKAMTHIAEVSVGPKIQLRLEAFQYLCDAGDSDILKMFLQKNLVNLHTRLISSPKSKNTTKGLSYELYPLDIGIRSGHLEILETLLDNGGDYSLDRNNPSVYTGNKHRDPLITAIKRVDPASIEVLIQHRRDSDVEIPSVMARYYLRHALEIKMERVYEPIRLYAVTCGVEAKPYKEARRTNNPLQNGKETSI